MNYEGNCRQPRTSELLVHPITLADKVAYLNFAYGRVQTKNHEADAAEYLKKHSSSHLLGLFAASKQNLYARLLVIPKKDADAKTLWKFSPPHPLAPHYGDYHSAEFCRGLKKLFAAAGALCSNPVWSRIKMNVGRYKENPSHKWSDVSDVAGEVLTRNFGFTSDGFDGKHQEYLLSHA